MRRAVWSVVKWFNLSGKYVRFEQYESLRKVFLVGSLFTARFATGSFNVVPQEAIPICAALFRKREITIVEKDD